MFFFCNTFDRKKKKKDFLFLELFAKCLLFPYLVNVYFSSVMQLMENKWNTTFIWIFIQCWVMLLYLSWILFWYIECRPLRSPFIVLSVIWFFSKSLVLHFIFAIMALNIQRDPMIFIWTLINHFFEAAFTIARRS